MMTMSEPGWYPDPQDDSQERFWNGTEWTEQVKAEEDAAERPVIVPSPHRRQNNAVLWGVLVLVLCLLVGSGWWLSTNVNQNSSAPEPTSPATGQATSSAAGNATPNDPAPSPVADSTSPAPSTPSTALGDGRPRGSDEIEKDLISAQNPLGLRAGGFIAVIPDCPKTATAEDSAGNLGSDGRITSGAGLSIPEITGLKVNPQKNLSEAFIHQANTTARDYSGFVSNGDDIFAVATVGTLSESDGFQDVLPSAQRVVGCIAGKNPEYNTSPAEIIDIQYRPEINAVWLTAKFSIQGLPNINAEQISVFTCLRDGVMHMALIDVTDYTLEHHPEDYDAIWNAFKDMRLPS